MILEFILWILRLIGIRDYHSINALNAKIDYLRTDLKHHREEYYEYQKVMSEKVEHELKLVLHKDYKKLGNGFHNYTYSKEALAKWGYVYSHTYGDIEYWIKENAPEVPKTKKKGKR